MHKLLACVLTVTAGLLLLASGTGELSEKDALKLISQYFGYPKPLVEVVHAGPSGSRDLQKFVKGIDALIRDGYLKSAPHSGGADKYYMPTSKGSKYVRQVYIKDSFPIYEGAVCTEVLRKIDEIRYDSRENTATISFTTALEPVEPFYSLFCINKYCDYFGEKIKRTEKQKLRLKKAGNIWTIGR